MDYSEDIEILACLHELLLDNRTLGKPQGESRVPPIRPKLEFTTGVGAMEILRRLPNG